MFRPTNVPGSTSVIPAEDLNRRISSRSQILALNLETLRSTIDVFDNRLRTVSVLTQHRENPSEDRVSEMREVDLIRAFDKLQFGSDKTIKQKQRVPKFDRDN